MERGQNIFRKCIPVKQTSSSVTVLMVTFQYLRQVDEVYSYH